MNKILRSRKQLNLHYLFGRVLTGKYQNPDETHEGARLNRFKGFMGRYRNSQSDACVKRYAEIADMVSSEHDYAPGWVEGVGGRPGSLDANGAILGDLRCVGLSDCNCTAEQRWSGVPL